MPKTKQKTEVSPLKGAALLKRVQELEHLSKDEKALECGYFAVMSDGSKRTKRVSFLKALMDAKGINLGGRSFSSGISGARSTNFRLSVQANGNLLISKTFTKKLNLSPGDEFEVRLGRKHIKLVQVEP